MCELEREGERGWGRERKGGRRKQQKAEAVSFLYFFLSFFFSFVNKSSVTLERSRRRLLRLHAAGMQ